jgi:hypothetical protein
VVPISRVTDLARELRDRQGRSLQAQRTQDPNGRVGSEEFIERLAQMASGR